MTGLRCAPDTGESTVMRTKSPAPVATAFSNSVMPTSPALSRSAAAPDPTMTITSAAVPIPSARTRCRRGATDAGVSGMVEHSAQRGQLLRDDAVVDPSAVTTRGDKPGVTQHFEVVADGWLALADRLGQLAGTDLTLWRRCDEAQQAESDWVAECLEGLGEQLGRGVIERVSADRRTALGVTQQRQRDGHYLSISISFDSCIDIHRWIWNIDV